MIERKPKSAVLFKINTEAVTIEHLSYDSVQENGAIKEAAVTLNIQGANFNIDHVAVNQYAGGVAVILQYNKSYRKKKSYKISETGTALLTAKPHFGALEIFTKLTQTFNEVVGQTKCSYVIINGRYIILYYASYYFLVLTNNIRCLAVKTQLPTFFGFQSN